MDVETGRSGFLDCIAIAAPIADVVGRLLAPSLLATAPLAVVALSPADPHLLLAASESRVVLVAVAFAVRLGRAWAIFRSVDHLATRSLRSPVRRLLVPQGNSRWRHYTGVAAVILLPGMVGAIIAGRAQLQPRLFLGLAACSTASGLALTLAASHIFDEQLGRASAFLAAHPHEFTLLVGAAIALSLFRRWRQPTSVPHART